MGRGACLSKESGEGVSQYFSQKKRTRACFLSFLSFLSFVSFLSLFLSFVSFGIDAEVVSK